ncbi:MAG: YggS family pyridoxal phosphate-dependent enzyme [Zoogloeaceae bacterium]|jgi:pyridoxal phosphate enzyme (YggS family)|nr:YggS family pyridoxal phosphate-dependent enzyme [Zoogloeaceae bacterium]
MNVILKNLQAVRASIAQITKAAGRAPEAVRLLAVSKTRPAEDVLTAALEGGQREFGENYAQEGVEKMEAVARHLPPGHPPLVWHFIGPLQANKTRIVAEHFDWLHSVERLKIAARLSAQRPAHLPPLQVCVQVNVSGEASKSGCAPEEALELCRAVVALPRLGLRGLMAIPAPEADFLAQRKPFARLRALMETLRGAGLALDTVSAGMSHDLAAAIHEGATLVRVGTAIFGERTNA